MDKPRFGQFLVNNDVIDDATLFEALVLQEKQQESLERIAIAGNFMTVKQVMSVFNELPDTTASFTDMAVRLGYINAGQSSELLSLQMQSRLKLGEMLLKMGALEQDTLDKMLEKFCLLSSGVA